MTSPITNTSQVLNVEPTSSIFVDSNEQFVSIEKTQLLNLVNRVEALVQNQEAQNIKINQLIAERESEKKGRNEISEALNKATVDIEKLNYSNAKLQALAGLCVGIALGCIYYVTIPPVNSEKDDFNDRWTTNPLIELGASAAYSLSKPLFSNK